MKIIKKLFRYLFVSILYMAISTHFAHAVGPEEREVTNLRLQAARRIAEDIFFKIQDPRILNTLPFDLQEYIQFMLDHRLNLEDMLMDAAKHNHFAYVKDFLSANTSTNIQDEDLQNSPLHWAVDNTNSEMVKLLLDAQADVNAKNILGDTPLMFAAKNQYNLKEGNQIIKMLVQYEADVDLKNTKGYTAVMYAIKYNHSDIAELLLKQTKDQRLYTTYWMWAIIHDTLNVAQWLLNNNHVTINQHEPISVKKYTALHIAIRSFHPDDLTKNKVPEGIAFLIDHGANIEVLDVNNQTPLHYAVKKDENFIITDYLLNRGARINATDSKHQTPLIKAAKKGAPLIIKLLLDRGANIAARDNDQKSALDHAREKGLQRPGYEEVIALLEQAEQRQ